MMIFMMMSDVLSKFIIEMVFKHGTVGLTNVVVVIYQTFHDAKQNTIQYSAIIKYNI